MQWIEWHREERTESCVNLYNFFWWWAVSMCGQWSSSQSYCFGPEHQQQQKEIMIMAFVILLVEIMAVKQVQQWPLVAIRMRECTMFTQHSDYQYWPISIKYFLWIFLPFSPPLSCAIAHIHFILLYLYKSYVSKLKPSNEKNIEILSNKPLYTCGWSKQIDYTHIIDRKKRILSFIGHIFFYYLVYSFVLSFSIEISSVTVNGKTIWNYDIFLLLFANGNFILFLLLNSNKRNANLNKLVV